MPTDWPTDWPTEPQVGLKVMLKPKDFDPKFFEPEWQDRFNVTDFFAEATILKMKPNGDLQIKLHNDNDFFNIRKKHCTGPPVDSLENKAIFVKPGEFWLFPPENALKTTIAEMYSIYGLAEERAEVSKVGKKLITACTCWAYEQELKKTCDGKPNMHQWGANLEHENLDGSASCEVQTEAMLCAFCQKTKKEVQNLKRCARCEKAWYCDKTCQKSHWPQHKKTCRAAEPLAETALKRLFAKVSEACSVHSQR